MTEKRKQKGKKAMGHVEMIISFVIFVSIITFLLIMFRPMIVFTKTTSASLDISESQILENISIKLTVQSINISNEVLDGNCVSLAKPEAIQDKIIMRNSTYNRINVKSDGTSIKFEKSGNFYRIYSSEEFAESNYNPVECLSQNYDLGVVKTYYKVSETYLNSLFGNYTADYQTLKTQLGLKNDFNLILRDNGGELSRAEIYKPSGIEIMARDVLIEILDKDGNVKSVILNIQVWS